MAPALVSSNGRETYAVVRLRAGSDDQKLVDYKAVKSAFVASGGSVTTSFGGLRPFYDDANVLTKEDVQRAELLSMPILLILLVIIFRSVVAALTPLIVGGLSIVGAFVVVRLITEVTMVSTFAINIITLIGLGLSIDYSLFVVSRFREEMAAGQPVRKAVITTMATAGRTVVVSGLTVTLAMAGLLLFPEPFLKSMGYGAMAAVVVAMVASLTVLPAGLAILGDRINALSFRRRTTNPDEGRGWARLAHSVMRRPWFYLIGVLLILGVLAAPVLRITFGGLGTRALPASAPARATGDALDRDFAPIVAAPVQILVTGAAPADVATVLASVQAIPSVTDATVVATSGTTTLINADYHGEPASHVARDIVVAARGVSAPAGVTIGVTGGTADLVDQLDSLGVRLPWMALFVIVVTCLLLFLAFGSVVLPIKAILMNIVSLGAAFGVVVYVFQQGHFASWLGFSATGVIEPTNPILMIVVLFGLATDYEVFLLSRIREEWDHRDPAIDPNDANRTAVATGLQRTGRIITSAALLLVIVVVGFASGRISFVKLIGVGMIVAIIVDATLVRALLVPATMRLLGRWNWWAPGPFGKLYRRYGIHESV
jgi:trehalose monomycolate/heme transporter